MKIITQKQIKALSISPIQCIDWVRESFAIKKYSQLPAKISVHPQGYDYYTAMPCLLPSNYNRVGLKMVHRVSGAVPSVVSDILLYETSTGQLLALMDCDWITAMRTGATATVAAQALRRSDCETYCFIGLGNTARATMLCLLESEPDVQHHVILLRYKNQAELFASRFEQYHNVTFEIMDNTHDMISKSDVIFSCITDAQEPICNDLSKFRPGCTLIPIHVRGFENCDTYFDRIFGDDTAPIRTWKHFSEFKHYAELSDVLYGTDGRKNDNERILSYNYGLGLHDALFATKIYESLKSESFEFEMNKETEKFWI